MVDHRYPRRRDGARFGNPGRPRVSTRSPRARGDVIRGATLASVQGRRVSLRKGIVDHVPFVGVYGHPLGQLRPPDSTVEDSVFRNIGGRSPSMDGGRPTTLLALDGARITVRRSLFVDREPTQRSGRGRARQDRGGQVCEPRAAVARSQAAMHESSSVPGRITKQRSRSQRSRSPSLGFASPAALPPGSTSSPPVNPGTPKHPVAWKAATSTADGLYGRGS